MDAKTQKFYYLTSDASLGDSILNYLLWKIGTISVSNFCAGFSNNRSIIKCIMKLSTLSKLFI